MLQMRVLARNIFAAGFGRQRDATTRPAAESVASHGASFDDALDRDDENFPDYCKYCRLGSGLRPGMGGVSGRYTH
jgi:hypothetical protein